MAPNAANIVEGLSEKEADQLAKHFKDPEFCRLFEDYAREMQDLKARAEQDAYLAQLEAQGELEGIYGQGVQVIQPEPGMVVKSKSADAKTRVYINVCTCSKVEEMVIERFGQGERAGANITLPNMLGIKGNREGKAPDGVPFRVWDFIVHPASLLRCTGNPALTEFLVSTAIEKLEEATQVKLLRKHKMLGVQYKGVDGEQRPPTLLLRTAGQGDVVDGRLRPLGQPGTAATAAAAAGAVKQSDTAQGRDAAQHTAGSAGRSSFSFTPKEKQSQKAAIEEAATTSATAGVRTPQYQVVERARADLGTTWSDAGRGLKLSNMPEALVVRVDLPGVSSVAGVDLSLTADSVSLEVPGKYQLYLPVRYKIKEQQASAKFLTNKQQLVLTLPVAAPPAEQASQQQHGQQLVQEVEQDVQEVEKPQQAVRQQQDAQAQDVQQPAGSTNSQSANCTVDAQPTSCPCSTDSASDTATQQGLEQAPQQRRGGETANAADSQQEQHVEAIMDRPSPDSSSQPPAFSSKTVNQLKWEELHHKTAADSSNNQQDESTVTAPHDATGQPSSTLPKATAAASKAAAPLLRPRLSSRRVCSSDFV